MFNPSGGRAITAIVPDGAAGRVLTYTGLVLGGGGGLVGPGASPSGGPGLVLVDGAGIDTGAHRYAYTFMTAAGESLPGPASVIPVGATVPPAYPPTPGVPIGGGAVEAGTHYYAVTFLTAAGETTSSPGSSPAIVGSSAGSTLTPAPTTAPTVTPSGSGLYGAGFAYEFRVTFVTPFGETPAGPIGTGTRSTEGGFQLSAIPLGPAGVTARKIYLNFGYGLIAVLADNVTTTYHSDHQESGSGIGVGVLPPTTNTAYLPTNAVPLAGLALGPANVTGRRIYRASGGGPYKLVTTIANNTATTYTDTTASASLGAVVPSGNTAAANRVQVTLGIGGAGVTARRLYRSKANLDPLLFHSTIADNTTTGFLDLAADAALGAGPPASDTSGLVQPSGQVPAGATSIIVANTTPFASTGGWAVVGNGEQVIRYTGKTATALTGIPPISAGSLTASISYNSTITASPMLVGVAGILELTLKGSSIYVWVQRDDLAAQAAMAALDGTGDGIYEHIVSDERRSEPSLIQICDAQLKLYSRPLVTVTYATRDLKTKSGKKVTITLASPAMNETLTIQDVAISELGIAPRLAPKFTVTASTVHHTFEAILQDLIRKADA